jgi:hypothetical protein
MKALLEKFPNLITFDDLIVGRINNYLYEINIKNGAKPIHCSPTRCSFKQMQLIDREVDKFERKDIVRPSKSSCSSMNALVKRKDGRPRLCQDYRPINELIEHNSYPVP